MGQSLVNNMYTSSYLKEYVGFISKDGIAIIIFEHTALSFHGISQGIWYFQ